jgi:hypothetical protein
MTDARYSHLHMSDMAIRALGFGEDGDGFGEIPPFDDGTYVFFRTQCSVIKEVLISITTHSIVPVISIPWELDPPRPDDDESP